MTGDPNAVRVFADDVRRFWSALEMSRGVGDERRRQILREHYLAGGSPGLRDWTRLRLADRAACARATHGTTEERLQESAADLLARTTLRRERFYESIRASTLRLAAAAGIVERTRSACRSLRLLHPDATFPDIYLLVGRLNAAGVPAPSGITIAVEMCAADAAMDSSELTAWERGAVEPPQALHWIIAHELMHYQQPSSGHAPSLLGMALREGGADFVASLIAESAPSHAARSRYGDVHERELWTSFREQMLSGDAGAWFYQGPTTADRPPDLGYYIGGRISETYYDRTSDKAAAVRRILTTTDPMALLHDSGYAERFAEAAA